MVRHLGDFFGNMMFVTDEALNRAVDKWAKEHFGERVKAGVFYDDDSNTLSVHLDKLIPEDYTAYVQAFSLYNVEGCYTPLSEHNFMKNLYVFLPAGVSKHLLVDVFGDMGLRPYGRILAAGPGVFFQDEDSSRGYMNRLSHFMDDGSDFRGNGMLRSTELSARVGYLIGKMEIQKEIEPVALVDLREVIGNVIADCVDALFEYCVHSDETKPFQVEDVARTVLLEKFGEKQLEDVLADANKRLDEMKHDAGKAKDDLGLF